MTIKNPLQAEWPVSGIEVQSLFIIKNLKVLNERKGY
jgi:hypothetical protein